MGQNMDDSVNDVSIMQVNNLNDSVNESMNMSMASVNQSMAGISDTDNTKSMVRVESKPTDESYISSNEDVVVKKADVSMASDVNMSMAGLSDMSMTEINRGSGAVNVNDSAADYSMASLGGEASMASINDTPKIRDQSKQQSDASSGNYASGQTNADSEAAEVNMLDGLKAELGMMSNQQGHDQSFNKQ